MRKGYSRTAEAVALARALQQTVPASQRILDDPYAVQFLQNPYLRLVAASRLSSVMFSSVLDFWATGGQEFVAIRARLADDLAREMAALGLKQLVLLGAGFDSMALRIKDALGAVTVFEVDHPATQAIKRKVMTQLGTPENLRFVSVDFERDDFGEKLEDAGLDRSQVSLVIWMGVSYYLTPQAMSRALTQISLLGGPGTRLTFDYILQGVIDRTSSSPAARIAARRVALVGEPWIFGLKPEDMGNYLRAFGFRLIKDYGPEELRQKYCPHRFKPMDYARIVVCERGAVPAAPVSEG
jgi:methyltransferase (TIGR00027 family)